MPCFTAAWGRGRCGVLGNGAEAEVPASSPTRLTGCLSSRRVQQLCCGELHSLALLESGAVFSWGSGLMGALGHGARSNQTSPRRVEALPFATQITAGKHQSAALCADEGGSVYRWGWDGWDGSPCRKKPTRLSSEPALSIAAGSFHLSVLTRANGIISIGGGEKEARVLAGVQVIRLSAGTRHSAVLTADRTVYVWRHPLDRPAPTPCRWLAGASEICCCGDFTAALVTNGARPPLIRWQLCAQVEAGGAELGGGNGGVEVEGAEGVHAGGGYLFALLRGGGAYCIPADAASGGPECPTSLEGCTLAISLALRPLNLEQGALKGVDMGGDGGCGTSSFRSEAQHMGHTSPLDPQAEQKGSTSSFLSQVQHGGGYSPFHSKAEYKGGTPSLNPQRQQPGAAPPLPSQLQGEMVGEFPTPANHVPTPDTPWLEHAVAEFAPPPHYLEPSPSVDVEAAFMRELDRLGSGGVLPAPSPRPPPERASQEVVSTASLSSLGARLDRVQAQLNELKLGNPAPATSASPAEATPADEAAVAQQVSSQLRAELKLEICEELRSALIDEIKGAVTADLAAQLKQMQTSLFAALRPSSRPPRNGSPEAACGVDASSVSQARGCCSPVYERESALSSSPDESANEARTSPPRSRGQQPPRGSGGVATGEGDSEFLLMEQMAEQATSPGPLRKPLPTSPASCFVAGPSELRPKPQANAAAAKPRPALRSATCRAPLADGSTSRSSEPSECAGVTPPLPSDVWAWARPPTPGGVARGGVAAAAHARTMEGRPGVRATPRRAATQSSEARAKNVASQEQLARRHVQGDHQYRERQRAPPADAKGVDPARAASISGQTCAKSTRACLGSRRASTGGLDGPQESSAKSNRKDHFTSASCAR
ncbi:MAG: hypothetical protein SGPRY_001278 [Prymnesium sp.]